MPQPTRRAPASPWPSPPCERRGDAAAPGRRRLRPAGRIAAARKQKLAVALDEFQAIAAFDGGKRGARAARRRPGPARCRLRLRRLRALAHGADARAAAAVLQGRPGDAAREDRRRRCSRGSSSAVHRQRRPCRSRGLAPPSSSWPPTCPTTSSGWLTRPGTTCRAAGRRAAGLDDLHLTLTRLLGEQHTVFEESWQRLTLAQRAVLRALVLEDGREMLSADVRTRHRLAGASSVQSALAALVKQDVVMKEDGRYVVTDSLYREWVARKTFSSYFVKVPGSGPQSLVLGEQPHNLVMPAARGPRERRCPGRVVGKTRPGAATRGGTRPCAICPYLAAHPSGVEQISSSRACRSAPWSMKSAAFPGRPSRRTGAAA